MLIEVTLKLFSCGETKFSLEVLNSYIISPIQFLIDWSKDCRLLFLWNDLNHIQKHEEFNLQDGWIALCSGELQLETFIPKMVATKQRVSLVERARQDRQVAPRVRVYLTAPRSGIK